MKRFFSLRALFSLALLWMAATALVWSLKSSILDMGQASFQPLAILPMLLAYLLGFGSWPERRAAALLLILCPFLILIEATRSGPAIWQILSHLPALQISTLFALFTGQSVDVSFFRFKLDEITHLVNIFIQNLTVSSKGPSPTLLEVMWDVPLYLICAWSGWWSSRRSSILIALIPSLGLQVFLLNYAKKQHGLTLQIGVFALIFLMSLHQKWSLSKSESKTQVRVRMETYVTIFSLAAMLAAAAGWAPIIPTPIPPTKTPKPQQAVEKPDAVESEGVQEVTPYNSGPPAGLPRNHVIDGPPQSQLDVVFLANTGEVPFSEELGSGNAPTGELHYWRWITYDQYNGRTWSSSTTTSASYAADQALFDFSGEGYQRVHQNITKASAEDDHLYWTGFLVNANQSISTTWRTDPPAQNPLLHMDMLGSTVETQQYAADSLVPKFSEDQLRAASQIYPTEILEKYLSLPRNTISQRVRDLAVNLTYQAQNPYDKAKAIEAYLRTYPYTLEVPPVPDGKEISDYFLFEIKTGYCEYYASSMIVMARTIGLPARMVIGYASSEYDSRTAQYIVREAHSHSWVEIYFPDLGWVEFEPTASQPLRGQPPEELNAETPQTPTHKDRSGIIYQKHGYFIKGSPILPVLLLMLAIIGTCLVYLRLQGLWFSYKTIGSIYEYIFRHGKKIVPNSPPNATPALFAKNLKSKLMLDHAFLLPAEDELDQLTSLYLQETYSRHAVTPLEQQEAVKTWYRLFWRLLYARMVLALRNLLPKRR